MSEVDRIERQTLKRIFSYEKTKEDSERRKSIVRKTRSVFMYHIGYRLIGYSLAILHEIYLLIRRKKK